MIDNLNVVDSTLSGVLNCDVERDLFANHRLLRSGLAYGQRTSRYLWLHFCCDASAGACRFRTGCRCFQRVTVTARRHYLEGKAKLSRFSRIKSSDGSFDGTGAFAMLKTGVESIAQDHVVQALVATIGDRDLILYVLPN